MLPAASPDVRRTAPGRREILTAAGAFVAAAVVLTLPVAVHPGRTLPSDLIDTLLNSWILGWDSQRLLHGLRGVWNAPVFFPYHDTLAFSENLFGIAFLVAPVYWATGNAVLAYNVAFVLSFAIAGIGMYLLVRSLTFSAAAAAIGGAAYAFCPYRFAQMMHLQMVATGWIPVALWGLHQYFSTRRRTWLAVFAASYVLQALSNSYVAYFMAVPAAIIAIAGLWRAAGGRLRAASDVAVACLAIAVVLAPVGVEYYRVRRDYNQVRSPGDIASRSADVRSYLVSRNFIGTGRWLPTAVYNLPENELFPGLAAAVLAAIGVIAGSRRRDRSHAIGAYAAIAVAGFALSLGPHVRVWGRELTEHGPYEWLLQVVPGMNGMRVPARFAIVFEVGLSVLAAFGALAIVERVRTDRKRVAVTLALVAAIVADGWTVPLPIVRYSGRGRPEDRGIAEWLRGRPAGGVLHLPIRTNNFQELSWQYVTLVDGHPIVNGLSGYDTPLQLFLRDPRAPLYDYGRYTSVVRALRALGVRYVVVHQGDYSITQQAALEPEQTLQGLRASGQTVAETRVLNTLAFELAPWDAADNPAGEPIPPADFETSVSGGDDRRATLTDGDPDTRWIATQDGGAWISVAFRSPHDIAAVTLQLAERSLFDYPRELQIESTDAAGRSEIVYRNSPYPEVIRALVSNPEYSPVTIALPPNRSMAVTIRETGVSPGTWWSVHEIRLRQRVTTNGR